MLGSFHHIDIRESFSCRWKGSNCFCRTRHFSASLGKKYSCLLYLSSLNRSMHMPTVDYFHMFQVIDHIWTVLLLYQSKFCYLYRMWERGSIVFTYICLSSSCQIISYLYWMPYRVTSLPSPISIGSLLPCLLILIEWFPCLIWLLWKSFLWIWI